MGWEIREATEKDYESVLDLDPNHEIQNGNDYMPAMFHSFVNDPNRKVNIFLVDGKIVGLAMRYIVDGGHTLVRMSARTNTRIRGKGYWREFRNAGISTLDIPNIQRNVGVTSSWWHRLRLHIQPGFGQPFVLDKRSLFTFLFNPDCTRSYVSDSTTRLLLVSEWQRILDDRDATWRLFPTRHIMCGPGEAVYRIMKENYPLIEENTLHVSGSWDGSYRSIAFSHGYPVHKGYEYVLNYYTEGQLCLQDVQQHVNLHVPLAAKRAVDAKNAIIGKRSIERKSTKDENNLYFTLITPVVSNPDEIENLVRKCHGHNDQPVFYRTNTVFEIPYLKCNSKL